MTALPKSCRRPFFLNCEERQLFSILHSPESPESRRSSVIYFAPFAEEANRARRMASLLAEDLCGAGMGTLLFDYSSTGDSAGQFSRARWEHWISDGCAAIEWLSRETDRPVAVVGLRLGAAIALECVRKVGLDVPRVVLWQPVTSGRTYFTQFLRIRLAASLAEGGERETTSQLMDRFAAGDTLEVAGYGIAPHLADAMGRVNLADLVPPPHAKVHWFEVTTGEDDALMPPSQRTIERWCDEGIDVTPSVISGEQFWATQEISTAPALIEATRAALTGVAA